MLVKVETLRVELENSRTSWEGSQNSEENSSYAGWLVPLKILKDFWEGGKRPLLGGLSLAASRRTQSSSPVEFERLEGMGKPTEAKGRGTLAGQGFGGGSVMWFSSPGGLWARVTAWGEEGIWSVMLRHSKHPPLLPLPDHLGHFLVVLLVSKQYYINSLKQYLSLSVLFLFSDEGRAQEHLEWLYQSY